MTPPLDVAALRALLEKGTPGPWFANSDPSSENRQITWHQITTKGHAVAVGDETRHGPYHRVLAGFDGCPTSMDCLDHTYKNTVCLEIAHEGGGFVEMADIELAVAAVNALPALLAELEGVRARDAEYCELADLLTEAAKDLESEIDARYGYPDVHPALRNKYNRDSETVTRLQKAADRARGEGGR